jgi:hypothetical protein
VSVVASVKSRLVGTSNVLAALLPGVVVAYSAPVRDIPRELVYGGTVIGPVEVAAFAGGGRIKRSEDLTTLLHIRVYKPGATREWTDGRAAEIADVIANYIAANWTLGDLPELKKAVVAGVETDGWSDDDGSGSTYDMAIGLMSYLT